MIDFVTVVFEGDLLLQRLQARSIALFADPDLVGRIHIINNDEPELESVIHETIVPEYGRFAGQVRVHHWTDLIPDRMGASGWRSQQVLKLKIAEFVESELYIVFDGKNHFIRPTAQTDLVRGGKPVSFFARPNGNLAEYFRETMLYYGLDPEVLVTASMPATTPYILHTGIVRDMMRHVAERENQSFDAYFLSKRYLTEFYMYFAYLNLLEGGPSAYYHFGRRFAVTLFTRWPQREEDITKALGFLDHPQYKVFGLHRNRTGSMRPEHREIIIRHWHDSGLIIDRAEAEHVLGVDGDAGKVAAAVG